MAVWGGGGERDSRDDLVGNTMRCVMSTLSFGKFVGTATDAREILLRDR